ncbi:hypothetical protein [Sphingomonas sp.]|jgi:hypothetical protein|uniref:hypothetical protein n=1 Tax=Sphingomonas sp. TaxID=28214 RepID=UPI002EDAAC08
MSSHDFDYYARRVEQERRSAARAEDRTAKRVHEEMAARYTERLSELAPMRLHILA